MASKNKAALLLKQKEAKQKKVLFALVPIFLLIVAWQGPKMYKALFAGPEMVSAPTPTVTTPAAPAPTSPTEGDGATPAPPAGSLPDTDDPPEADLDELISFSRFTGRDPFVQQGTPGSSGDTTGEGTGGPSDGTTATSAVFETNGSTDTVTIGGAFPAGDPTFTLVSLNEDSAVVGLVQGMFEDGSSTVEIALGERVVLVSAPDSTRYTVELVSIG